MATDDDVVSGHWRREVVREVDRAEVDALKVLRHQDILRNKLWWILRIVVVPDAHLRIVTHSNELQLSISRDERIDLHGVVCISGHVSRASHEA